MMSRLPSSSRAPYGATHFQDSCSSLVYMGISLEREWRLGNNFKRLSCTNKP